MLLIIIGVIGIAILFWVIGFCCGCDTDNIPIIDNYRLLEIEKQRLETKNYFLQHSLYCDSSCTPLIQELQQYRYHDYVSKSRIEILEKYLGVEYFDELTPAKREVGYRKIKKVVNNK